MYKHTTLWDLQHYVSVFKHKKHIWIQALPCVPKTKKQETTIYKERKKETIYIGVLEIKKQDSYHQSFFTLSSRSFSSEVCDSSIRTIWTMIIPNKSALQLGPALSRKPPTTVETGTLLYICWHSWRSSETSSPSFPHHQRCQIQSRPRHPFQCWILH